MKKTAIILGATGLTGSLLLEKLINDSRYDTIKIFARKSVNNSSPKVKEFIANIINLDDLKPDFTGDEVYCCIGTTTKKTPDKNLYRDIDYGIPTKSAQLCKENNISTLVVISALGADPQSTIF